MVFKSNLSAKSARLPACFKNCHSKDFLECSGGRPVDHHQRCLTRSGSRFQQQNCRATSSLSLLQCPFSPLGGRSVFPDTPPFRSAREVVDRPSQSSAAQQPRTKNSDNDQLNWKAVGMGFSLLGQLLINESTGKTWEKRDHLIKVLMKIKPFQK